MSILSAAVTLFLVMDPIGNTPTFVALLKDVPEARRSRVILRENLFDIDGTDWAKLSVSIKKNRPLQTDWLHGQQKVSGARPCCWWC